MLVGHTSVVFSLGAFTENRVLVKRFTLRFPTGQNVLGVPRDKGQSKIHGTVPEQGQKKKKSWEKLLCHSDVTLTPPSNRGC